MSNLYRDTFNRADGALGGDWTVAAGTVDISGNRMRFHTSSSRAYVPMPAGAKYDQSVVLTLPSTNAYNPSYPLTVILRSNAAGTTGYRFVILCGPDGTASLSVDARVYPNLYGLGVYQQFALASGAHVLVLQCLGTLITAKLDAQTIFAVADSRIASGDYISLGAGGIDQWYIDQFDVDDATAASMSVIPNVVLPGSESNVLELLGRNTNWDEGAPGSPTFTFSAGTVTSQAVVSATDASIVYTAPTVAGPVTITDPSTSQTATLMVTTSPLDPPSGGADPFGIIRWLAANLAPLQTLLGYHGFYTDYPYLSRIIDELGIPTDEEPTDGNVKALVADATAILAQLTQDLTDPDSIHQMLYADGLLIDNTNTVVNDMTSANTVKLQDVIDAVGGGTPGATIQDVLDALGSLSDLCTSIQASAYYIDSVDTIDLAQVISAIGTEDWLAVGTMADRVKNLWDWAFDDNQYGTITPATIEGKVDAVAVDAAAANSQSLGAVTAIGLLSAALALAVGTITGAITASTVATEGTIGAASVVTDGLIEGLAAEVTGGMGDIALSLSSISGTLGTMDGKLDDVLELLQANTWTAPVWPGLASVTITDVQELVGSQTIDGPMDGILLEVTAYPPSKKGFQVGTLVNLERVGFVTFLGIGGYADERQPLAFTSQVYTPKRCSRASGVVVHCVGGVEYTVTSWDLGATP